MLMIFYVFEKARATTRRVVNVVVLAPSWGDPSQPQRDVAAQGAGRGPVPPLRPNPHHGYFRGGAVPGREARDRGGHRSCTLPLRGGTPQRCMKQSRAPGALDARPYAQTVSGLSNSRAGAPPRFTTPAAIRYPTPTYAGVRLRTAGRERAGKARTHVVGTHEPAAVRHPTPTYAGVRLRTARRVIREMRQAQTHPTLRLWVLRVRAEFGPSPVCGLPNSVLLAQDMRKSAIVKHVRAPSPSRTPWHPATPKGTPTPSP